MKRGFIEKNPLVGFGKLPETPRDRILTPDEEARLLSVLERNKSYLLMPVKLSLRNPIRNGDLITLTRENLDRFRPWVHFYASKTCLISLIKNIVSTTPQLFFHS
jgi:integrase